MLASKASFELAYLEQLLMKKFYSHILNATLHKRVPSLSGVEDILK